MPKHSKNHHAPDYAKNKDADVIAKGSAPFEPKDHWVQDVGSSVFPVGVTHPSPDAWLPMRGKDRPRPHVKVNECDH